jgi:hypothetical protein
MESMGHAATISGSREREWEKMTEKKESSKNYKGFVAGVFSGIAKLSGQSSCCCEILLYPTFDVSLT